ncbi:MAG: hypothetical protein QOJ91_1558 [Sphingomonadales bacterium]|jgi:hypothetical protein|nr:hypothetical protein [Sphingomonadales bacterium]
MSEAEDQRPTVPSSPAGSTKACRICAHAIPSAAVKCTVCDSYQNWLGKVHLSTTTLSLLVALVATSATAIPIIGNLTKVDDSEMYVRFWSASEESLVLVAVNTGTRPGFIAGGHIMDSHENGIPLIPAVTKFNLISPGKAELIRFKLPNKRLFKAFLDHVDIAGDCDLNIQVMNFRSDRAWQTSTFKCLDLRLATTNMVFEQINSEMDNFTAEIDEQEKRLPSDRKDGPAGTP